MQILGGKQSELWAIGNREWLVRSSTDRAVRFRALARDIVLCSWARRFTHGASLHPGA